MQKSQPKGRFAQASARAEGARLLRGRELALVGRVLLRGGRQARHVRKGQLDDRLSARWPASLALIPCCTARSRHEQ